MFIYPWGDMHSLNLGWFLMEFKAWVEKIEEYLDNGGGTSENLANVIAPVFNAENSYLTGDYVLYNDELYKALEPVPPGTWNPDAWARCLVTEEMGSASSGVDNVARLMIARQYSNTYNYQKYAICRYADKLWMCNTNLPAGGEEWEPSHWDEITVGAGLTGLRRSVETLSNDVTLLNRAFKTTKNITAISDLGTESCFFNATQNITLSPSAMTIPQYSKGLFITSGSDAIIVAITSSGHLIIAYRNGSNWVNPADIKSEIDSIETAVNRIGEYVESTSLTTSVPSGEPVTNLRSITLTRGVWSLNGYFNMGQGFAENVYGFIQTGAGTTLSKIIAPAVGGGAYPVSAIVNVTDDSQTFYLAAYQATGETKTVTTNHLRAVRNK